MKKQSLPPVPFKLARASDRRSAYLVRWMKERAFALSLKSPTPYPALGKAPHKLPCPIAPKDWHVQPGDIRLLGRDCLDVPNRPFIYVAVLSLQETDGLAQIAPFSPYGTPATAGEWQTPLKPEPLRVLQLWNTRTVPLFRLAQSWRTDTLTAYTLATAQTILKHIVSGARMPDSLREQTGLPIYEPADPRLAYVEEEIQLLAPLTAAARSILEAWPASENAAVAWLNAQAPALALAAGTPGEKRAEVVWLNRFGKKRWIGQARLDACTPDGKGWQIDWQIENPPSDLSPGLQVHIGVRKGRHWRIVCSAFLSRNKKNECWVLARLAEPAGTAGKEIAAGAAVRLVVATPRDT